MSKIKCILKINGVSKELKIHEDKQLIFVIRDEFGLTGTKLGCGLEQCGSCAILIDGKKKLSCNIFASDYQNNEITTIEGISNDRVLNVVQKAFKKFNAKLMPEKVMPKLWKMMPNWSQKPKSIQNRKKDEKMPSEN